ncbi:hypothetical protein BGZ74_007651, partial [Mortierella antarctica]
MRELSPFVEHIGLLLDLKTRRCKFTAPHQDQCLRLLRELQAFRGNLHQSEWTRIIGLLGWARGGSPYILQLLSARIEAAKKSTPPSQANTLLPYDELSTFFQANDPIKWSTRTTAQTTISDATFTQGGIIHSNGIAIFPVPSEYCSNIFLAELLTASCASGHNPLVDH